MDCIPAEIPTSHPDYNIHHTIAMGTPAMAHEGRAALRERYKESADLAKWGPQPDKARMQILLGLKTKRWSDTSTTIQDKVQNGPPPILAPHQEAFQASAQIAARKDLSANHAPVSHAVPITPTPG